MPSRRNGRKIFPTAGVGKHRLTTKRIGLLAVLSLAGIGLRLAPSNAEDQNPTWELYGADRHYQQYKKRGGWISFLRRWRTEERNEVFVYKPGVAYESLATKRVW